MISERGTVWPSLLSIYQLFRVPAEGQLNLCQMRLGAQRMVSLSQLREISRMALCGAASSVGPAAPKRLYSQGVEARLWFHDGLSFQCTQCGKCCLKPVQQQITVNAAERGSIARHLDIDVTALRRDYLESEYAATVCVSMANAFESSPRPAMCMSEQGACVTACQVTDIRCINLARQAALPAKQKVACLQALLQLECWSAAVYT
jgi:hypothetical protein